MKKIISWLTPLRLKVLMLFLCITAANVTMADEMDTVDVSRWMSQLPRDMRLSQLSIPKAHDAATWSSCLCWVSDQRLDQVEMFKKGVRAFDERINDGYALPVLHGKIGEDGGYFNHNQMLLNNFDEEFQHMPTRGELDKECIFFLVTLHCTFKDDESQVRTFHDFVNRVAELYGKENIIGLSDTLCLKDVEGKVVIVTEEGLGNPSKDCPATINFRKAADNDKKVDSYDDVYKDIVVKTWDETGDSVAVKPGIREYFHDYSQHGFISDIMNTFKGSLTEYHNRISELNTENLFFNTWLNGYCWPGRGGIGTAADESIFGIKYQTGVNHLTTDYLKQIYKPLGVVGFDFCGTNETLVLNADPHGDDLLREIIRHNFIKGGFISEIALWSAGKREDAEKALRDRGYTPARGFNNDVEQGAGGNYVIMGVKYTSNPAEAINDVRILELSEDDKTVPPTELVWNWQNKDYYYKLATVFDENHFNGSVNSKVPQYICYSKASDIQSENDHVLESLSLEQSSEDKGVRTVNYVGNGYIKDGGSYADLDRGETSKVWLRLMDSYHKHTKYGHYSLNHSDLSTHTEFCSYCNAYLSEPTEHNYKYTQLAHGKHIKKCEECGYVLLEDCKTTSYTNELVGDNNGIGTCNSCGGYAVEEPSCSDSVYQIKNAGNLYWFASHVNFGACTANAKLVNDITVNKTVDSNSLKWFPIGSVSKDEIEAIRQYEDSLKIDLSQYSNAWKGTFDGNGHTISGLYVDAGNEESSKDVDRGEGLFSYIHGGTVKHLGIINSLVNVHYFGGSFAGAIRNGHLEDVYSTAAISGIVDNYRCRGGISGTMRNSTLKNAYYCGNVDTQGSGPVYASAMGFETDTIQNYFFHNSDVNSVKSILLDTLWNEKPSVTVYTNKSDFNDENHTVLNLLNDGRKYTRALWFQGEKDELPRFATENERWSGITDALSDTLIFNEPKDAGALDNWEYNSAHHYFSAKFTDTESKLSVDLYSEYFGTSEDNNIELDYRLKAEDPSSDNNKLTFNAAYPGKFIIFARNGSSSETGGNVVVVQNGDTILNRTLSNSDYVAQVYIRDGDFVDPNDVFPPICVYVENGDFTVTYPSGNVNFYGFTLTLAEQLPVSVSLEQPDNMAVGDIQKVHATITDCLNNEIMLPLVYTSSDTSVANVDADGNITAVGAGEATITAAFSGNGPYEEASTSMSVTVEAATGIREIGASPTDTLVRKTVKDGIIIIETANGVFTVAGSRMK